MKTRFFKFQISQAGEEFNSSRFRSNRGASSAPFLIQRCIFLPLFTYYLHLTARVVSAVILSLSTFYIYIYICIDYICIIHDHNPPRRLKILTVHSMYNVIVILMVALFATWVKGDTNFVEQRSSQVDLFDRLRDESRCCSSYDFVKKRRKFIFEFVESNCFDKSLNVCRLNKV